MKGFTLIELMVVVLIVSILAAVALPQYEKAVEKSRLAEALVIGKAIVEAQNRSLVAFPNDSVATKSALDIKLNGGSWNAGGTEYTTDKFTYKLAFDGINVIRAGDKYILFMGNHNATSANWCHGDICSSITSMGFTGTAPDLEF